MKTTAEMRNELALIARGETPIDEESTAILYSSLFRWLSARLLMAEVAVATNGESGSPMHGVEARQVGALLEQLENLRRIQNGLPSLYVKDATRRIPKSVNVNWNAIPHPDLGTPPVIGLHPSDVINPSDYEDLPEESVSDCIERELKAKASSG